MAQIVGRTCLKVSAVLILLLFFQFAKAQVNFNDVDTKLQQYLHELGGNAVMLIYKDDKIVQTKELGVNFKANTQAPIGSCSKWLTAALVMTFVDEGKISLDDKITTYLPLFADYSKSYITIRQCLCHLTGIEGDNGVARGIEGPSLEDQVNNYASKHEIIAYPGAEFRYSNIGLNIAGRILEIVGKKSFEQLMQQRILKPLGMKNTSFQLDFDRPPSPSGSAVSTAADYMNFLAMILNKGMFKDKRILSENAIAQMEQSQTTPGLIKYAPKAAEGFNYGFGVWLVEQDANGKGTCMATPSLFGTCAIVDRCRGYASIIFVKPAEPGQKKEVFMDIKKSVDEIYPCKN